MTSKNAAGLDLHIPQVAIDTLNVCGVDAHLHDRDDACVKAISAPVVAAELRRIAADIAEDAALIKRGMPTNSALWSDLDRADMGRVIQGEDNARALRRRADELDPPAGTRED